MWLEDVEDLDLSLFMFFAVFQFENPKNEQTFGRKMEPISDVGIMEEITNEKLYKIQRWKNNLC